MSIPDYLFPPDLLPGAAELVAAFWRLGTNRNLGMGGVGPIPTLAIEDWLDRVGNHDLDERAMVVDAILAMDRPFMAQINRKPGDKTTAITPRVSAPPLTPAVFDGLFGKGKSKSKSR